MVKKRLIPGIDVADGRVVKGVRFENLREMGDPVELATRYSELGADELVFLDITATIEGRKTMLDVVERAAAALEIPFTVGGGVAGLDDARALLLAGADKVAVNRAAGEILLTSIDADGTRAGYDLALTGAVADAVPVPVIASGGAGCVRHLAEAFEVGAEAALVASIVHEAPERIPALKRQLAEA